MENLNLDVLATIIDGEEAANHFDELIAIGMRPSLLATHMKSKGLATHAEEILDDGVSPDELVARIEQADLGYCVESLLKHGFDATKLAEMVSKDSLGQHIKLFRTYGADEELLQKVAYLDIDCATIKELLPYNSFFVSGYPSRVTARYLLRAMGKKRLAKNCERVLQLGLNPDIVVKHLAPEGIIDNLTTLVNYGADATSLAEQLPPTLQLECHDELAQVGAKLDSDRLIRHVMKHHDGVVSITTVAILAMEVQDVRLGALERLYRDSIDDWPSGDFEEEEPQD